MSSHHLLVLAQLFDFFILFSICSFALGHASVATVRIAEQIDSDKHLERQKTKDGKLVLMDKHELGTRF